MNATFNCITDFLRASRASSLHVQSKVQLGTREPLADIFLDVTRAAVDVTVTHPLAPSLEINAHAAKNASVEKENFKSMQRPSKAGM